MGIARRPSSLFVSRIAGSRQYGDTFMNTTPDRAHLRFPDAVKRHFAFLETKGFVCIHTEPTLVRFRSKGHIIAIYHGRRSYEIGLEIENMQGSGSYPLSALLYYIHHEAAERYRQWAGVTPSGVEEGVRQLASYFNDCLNCGILEDRKLFDRLARQVEERSRNYNEEIRLNHARREADSAWAQRNFRELLRILTPFRDRLQQSELMKIEYAKKKMSKEK